MPPQNGFKILDPAEVKMAFAGFTMFLSTNSLAGYSASEANQPGWFAKHFGSSKLSWHSRFSSWSGSAARLNNSGTVTIESGTLRLEGNGSHTNGAFVFATVLDRFFSLFASINSFTRLVVRSKGDSQLLFEGKARSGTKFLI